MDPTKTESNDGAGTPEDVPPHPIGATTEESPPPQPQDATSQGTPPPQLYEVTTKGPPPPKPDEATTKGPPPSKPQDATTKGPPPPQPQEVTTKGPPPPKPQDATTKGPPPPQPHELTTKGPPPPKPDEATTKGPPPPKPEDATTKGPPPPPHPQEATTKGPPPPKPHETTTKGPPPPKPEDATTKGPPLPHPQEATTKEPPPPKPHQTTLHTNPPTTAKEEPLLTSHGQPQQQEQTVVMPLFKKPVVAGKRKMGDAFLMPTIDPEHLKNLQEQTNFHKVEVKKFYSTFMELSNGGRDSLDKDQFKKGLTKLEACGLKNLENTPFADHLFHLLAICNDGTLDPIKLLSSLSLLCKGSVEEKLELLFKAYDRDENGLIDKSELYVMIKTARSVQYCALGACHGNEKLDMDGLFKFSEAMATMIADKAFDMMDVNGDVLLSLEKLQQFAFNEYNIITLLSGFTEKRREY